MALRAVVFDVGETLVDETGMWERAADAAGVPRFTLMGVLGGLAARGEHHRRAWEILGVDHPASTWGRTTSIPMHCPAWNGCALRAISSAPSGTRPPRARSCCESTSIWSALPGAGASRSPRPSSSSGSSRRAASPAGEIAYVGDRVDNDIRPAIDAGMLAIHIRRGPWGHLFDAPPRAFRILDLSELPEALAGV